MADKSDNSGRVEKALQPVARPMTMVQPNQGGEQAGLQPVARPNPTGSGAGSGGADKPNK